MHGKKTAVSEPKFGQRLSRGLVELLSLHVIRIIRAVYRNSENGETVRFELSRRSFRLFISYFRYGLILKKKKAVVRPPFQRPNIFGDDSGDEGVRTNPNSF